MPDIEHVIVLMFENRSFDHLFGWLYPPPVGLDDTTDSNPVDPNDPLVKPTPATWIDIFASKDGTPSSNPDPCHEHDCVIRQIFREDPQPQGANGLPPDQTRTNEGFVWDFALAIEEATTPPPGFFPWLLWWLKKLFFGSAGVQIGQPGDIMKCLWHPPPPNDDPL